MEDIDVKNCPGCGHPMEAHSTRHCHICEEHGAACSALEPGVESPGG